MGFWKVNNRLNRENLNMIIILDVVYGLDFFFKRDVLENDLFRSSRIRDEMFQPRITFLLSSDCPLSLGSKTTSQQNVFC
jgi:hypothetical protein